MHGEIGTWPASSMPSSSFLMATRTGLDGAPAEQVPVLLQWRMGLGPLEPCCGSIARALGLPHVADKQF